MSETSNPCLSRPGGEHDYHEAGGMTICRACGARQSAPGAKGYVPYSRVPTGVKVELVGWLANMDEAPPLPIDLDARAVDGLVSRHGGTFTLVSVPHGLPSATPVTRKDLRAIRDRVTDARYVTVEGERLPVTSVGTADLGVEIGVQCLPGSNVLRAVCDGRTRFEVSIGPPPVAEDRVLTAARLAGVELTDDEPDTLSDAAYERVAGAITDEVERQKAPTAAAIVAVPRTVAPGVTVADEALESMRDQLRADGSVVVEGERLKLESADVTPRGLEVVVMCPPGSPVYDAVVSGRMTGVGFSVGAAAPGEDADEEIGFDEAVCPGCGHRFPADPWVTAACPKCGRACAWVTNQDVESGSEIDWEPGAPDAGVAVAQLGIDRDTMTYGSPPPAVETLPSRGAWTPVAIDLGQRYLESTTRRHLTTAQMVAPLHITGSVGWPKDEHESITDDAKAEAARGFLARTPAYVGSRTIADDEGEPCRHERTQEGDEVELQPGPDGSLTPTKTGRTGLCCADCMRTVPVDVRIETHDGANAREAATEAVRATLADAVQLPGGTLVHAETGERITAGEVEAAVREVGDVVSVSVVAPAWGGPGIRPSPMFEDTVVDRFKPCAPPFGRFEYGTPGEVGSGSIDIDALVCEGAPEDMAWMLDRLRPEDVVRLIRRVAERASAVPSTEIAAALSRAAQYVRSAADIAEDDARGGVEEAQCFADRLDVMSRRLAGKEGDA